MNAYLVLGLQQTCTEKEVSVNLRTGVWSHGSTALAPTLLSACVIVCMAFEKLTEAAMHHQPLLVHVTCTAQSLCSGLERSVMVCKSIDAHLCSP